MGPAGAVSGRMRVVIITGAGAGLGRALAREAASRDFIVVALGRAGASLVETGVGIDPVRYVTDTVDVSDPAAIEAAVQRVIARFGKVDALIANAAVYPRVALLEQTPAEWMRVIAINLGGVMASIHAVLPAMMAEAVGCILVVGSFADVAPIRNSSAYSVSKGALHSLVKATHAELAGDFPNILVNEWVPGALATGMGVPDGLAPAEAARWGIDLLDLPPGGPSGRMFHRDQLVQPPRSFKQRMIARLLRR